MSLFVFMLTTRLVCMPNQQIWLLCVPRLFSSMILHIRTIAFLWWQIQCFKTINFFFFFFLVVHGDSLKYMFIKKVNKYGVKVLLLIAEQSDGFNWCVYCLQKPLFQSST